MLNTWGRIHTLLVVQVVGPFDSTMRQPLPAVPCRPQKSGSTVLRVRADMSQRPSGCRPCLNPMMSLRGLVGPKMHEIILLGLQDQPQYAPSYPIPIPSPRRQCFKQMKRMFRLYRSFSRFARLRALRLFNRSFRTASHCHTAGHCFYAVSFNV